MSIKITAKRKNAGTKAFPLYVYDVVTEEPVYIRGTSYRHFRITKTNEGWNLNAREEDSCVYKRVEHGFESKKEVLWDLEYRVNH